MLFLSKDSEIIISIQRQDKHKLLSFMQTTIDFMRITNQNKGIGGLIPEGLSLFIEIKD
jgi:hypothetical protein